MNRLNIGEIILRLRKLKNLTQEQLASMVGVSAGAVSKWENGNSTPDITLLAPLARALNTSLDELLSFQSQLSETEVITIKQELIKAFLHDGYAAGEEKCLLLLNEYPNSIQLKCEVAGLIYMYLMMAEEPTEEFIKTKQLYSLNLFKQVIDSRDPKYTQMALFSTAHIQMTMNNYEESEKALKELPSNPIDPSVLYTRLYLEQGKNMEASKYCSGKLMNYILHSTTMLIQLARISRIEKAYDKSIFYLDTCYKLQQTFKIGLGSAAYNFCKLYMEMGQKEVAAAWFNAYVKEVISTHYDHESNPFFEKIKLEVEPEEQKIIRKKALKAILEEEEFKVLSGLEDYEKVIDEVQAAIKLLKN